MTTAGVEPAISWYQRRIVVRRDAISPGGHYINVLLSLLYTINLKRRRHSTTETYKREKARSTSTSHNTNRDLYTLFPLLNNTTKSAPITQLFGHNTIPQSPHHPLPSPSRQTQNLIVPQVSSHVKLECHNECFIRSVLFVQHRRGIELPNMRCGKVKNIWMTFDLIIYNHC